MDKDKRERRKRRGEESKSRIKKKRKSGEVISKDGKEKGGDRGRERGVSEEGVGVISRLGVACGCGR